MERIGDESFGVGQGIMFIIYRETKGIDTAAINKLTPGL